MYVDQFRVRNRSSSSSGLAQLGNCCYSINLAKERKFRIIAFRLNRPRARRNPTLRAVSQSVSLTLAAGIDSGVLGRTASRQSFASFRFVHFSATVEDEKASKQSLLFDSLRGSSCYSTVQSLSRQASRYHLLARSSVK